MLEIWCNFAAIFSQLLSRDKVALCKRAFAYVLTEELRVVKGLVTMAQGPINLSLFGSKLARGTPNRVFAFFFLSHSKNV